MRACKCGAVFNVKEVIGVYICEDCAREFISQYLEVFPALQDFFAE